MDHCVAPGEHRCSVLVYTGVFGLAAPSGGGGTVSLTSGDTTIAVVDGGCNDITTSTHQDDGPGWKVQLHTVYGTLLEFWATYVSNWLLGTTLYVWLTCDPTLQISLGDTGGINFRYDNNGPHSAWYYQSGDCQKRDWGFVRISFDEDRSSANANIGS